MRFPPSFIFKHFLLLRWNRWMKWRIHGKWTTPCWKRRYFGVYCKLRHSKRTTASWDKKQRNWNLRILKIPYKVKINEKVKYRKPQPSNNLNLIQNIWTPYSRAEVEKVGEKSSQVKGQFWIFQPNRLTNEGINWKWTNLILHS